MRAPEGGEHRAVPRQPEASLTETEQKASAVRASAQSLLTEAISLRDEAEKMMADAERKAKEIVRRATELESTVEIGAMSTKAETSAQWFDRHARSEAGRLLAEAEAIREDAEGIRHKAIDAAQRLIDAVRAAESPALEPATSNDAGPANDRTDDRSEADDHEAAPAVRRWKLPAPVVPPSGNTGTEDPLVAFTATRLDNPRGQHPTEDRREDSEPQHLVPDQETDRERQRRPTPPDHDSGPPRPVLESRDPPLGSDEAGRRLQRRSNRGSKRER